MNEGYFFAIAAIAIAITGFVGVISALKNRIDDEWPLNEFYGVKLILEHSIGGVFLALLPPLLAMSISAPSVVWSTASAALGTFLAYQFRLQLRRVRHSIARGPPARSLRMLTFGWFFPTIFVLMLQIANAFYWKGQVVFAIGVLWLLIAACTQFMHSFAKSKIAGGA